jgi:hypothetical protein
MELTGTIASVLPEQTGTGKNGVWKKQEFILETEGQYAKKVCFSLWGEKADKNSLQVGTKVRISFDLESREYNGKWYTEAKAWKVEPSGDRNEYQQRNNSFSTTGNSEEKEETTIYDNDVPF